MGRKAAALAACMALVAGLSPYAPARAEEAAPQVPAAQEEPAAGTGQAATVQQAAVTAEAAPSTAAATATGAASESASLATAQTAQGTASASVAVAQTQASTSTTTVPTSAQPASLTVQSATVPIGAQTSGPCGTCTWYITSATASSDPGQLVIMPTEGASGALVDSEHPWTAYASAVKSVKVEDGVVAAQNSAQLFYGLSSCTTMDLGGLDTSFVQDMKRMFQNCAALQTLALPDSFDTSSVKDMGLMFYNCEALQTLSLPASFKTSAVEDMNSMFDNCEALQTLALPDSFDTSSVKDMGFMFYNCAALQTLSLPDTFNTSAVENMNSMFNGCASLRALALPSAFDTSSVENTNDMFASCSSLRTLALPSAFDTSSVQDMSGMFSYCSALQTLALPAAFDTSAVQYMGFMFNGCSALQTLSLPAAFDTSSVQYMNNMFDGCSALRTLVVGGSGFTFKDASAVLPTPPSTSPYDGKWKKGDGTTEYTPSGMQALTGSELTGTWVWSGDIAATPVDWSGAYDGAEHTGSVSVQDPATGYTIRYGTDGSTFTLTTAPLYSALGAYRTFYKITATGWPDKTGSFVTAIFAMNASAAKVSAAEQVYTGSALTPTPTVTLTVGGTTRTLVAGTDYDVTYADNTDVGTARYSIAFKGGYWGTAKGTFAIAPKAVTVTADDKDKAYGDTDPALTATVSGTVGADTVAYTLSRAAGEDAGTYAITPTGAATQGNYTVTFKAGALTILPAVQTRTFVIDGAEVTATLTGSSKSIDGLVVARRASASDAVTGALGGRVLQGDWDVYFTDGTTEGFGTLTLAFPATGGTVQVWEVHSGALTRGADQAVSGGTASATVTTLSEFAVTSAADAGSTATTATTATTAATTTTAAKASTSATATPRTGDGSGGAPSALLLAAAGAALAALAAGWRRRAGSRR
jgi:surface protein